LIDAASWRFVFLINVPLVAVAVFCVGVATYLRREADDRITALALCGAAIAGLVWFFRSWHLWSVERLRGRGPSKK